jgi:hypothetical protein
MFQQPASSVGTVTLRYNGRVCQAPTGIAPAELPETLSYNGRTYYTAQRVADPKLSQTLQYNGRVYQIH